ncbi:head-tail adaptor protein [Lactococcus kimchii]|uniref:head-tail adaptor protein n=1 Tax=Lactococcus sp. S-13 TaxID=2507158 RepID=UPI001022B4B0|nr:head-tail adaptor protein [Lactococcus sp. S-13]RZI47965.1 head-tail adaptor protein [Lactococcus sp. S-13]RZI48425.1 head-tail adaptor protein [Lactococcus sp. S-13]RZI48783.1 head-tail adaptor protein [Lactococcus sp. S-13]
MYPTQNLVIRKKERTPDGLGGFNVDFVDFITLKGYIDLASGTDQAVNQNAIVEESTHYAIIPKYVSGIKKDMELVDEQGKIYAITYVDDPMGIHHHLELYLTFKKEEDNGQK